MAGQVRQPIDIKALEKYLDENVPEIKTPIDLKQVRKSVLSGTVCSHIIVWLWSIESHISDHICKWPTIRDEEEATRQASLKDCTSSRSRIQDNTCS